MRKIFRAGEKKSRALAAALALVLVPAAALAQTADIGILAPAAAPAQTANIGVFVLHRVLKESKKGEALEKRCWKFFYYREAHSDNDRRKCEERELKLADKAVKAAGELAKKKGYIMVLETEKAGRGLVFSLETLDLTEEIIKAVDQ